MFAEKACDSYDSKISELQSQLSRKSPPTSDASTNTVPDNSRPDLQVGTFACLRDLQKDSMNGLVGYLLAYDANDGRWEFLLNGTPKTIRVKSANVARM